MNVELEAGLTCAKVMDILRNLPWEVREEACAKLMDYEIRMKAGPLRNGAERGHGSVWHAITGQFHDTKPALCGQSPRIMWSSWQPKDLKVTCPRCIKKIGPPPPRDAL